MSLPVVLCPQEIPARCLSSSTRLCRRAARCRSASCLLGVKFSLPVLLLWELAVVLVAWRSPGTGVVLSPACQGAACEKEAPSAVPLEGLTSSPITGWLLLVGRLCVLPWREDSRWPDGGKDEGEGTGRPTLPAPATVRYGPRDGEEARLERGVREVLVAPPPMEGLTTPLNRGRLGLCPRHSTLRRSSSGRTGGRGDEGKTPGWRREGCDTGEGSRRPSGWEAWEVEPPPGEDPPRLRGPGGDADRRSDAIKSTWKGTLPACTAQKA